MSNENEKSMGDGQPSKDKITIEIESQFCVWDGMKNPPPEGKWELNLPLSYALKVVEATVKYLNQTKEAGRQEIRTLKDKENQKLVDYFVQRYTNLRDTLNSDLTDGDGPTAKALNIEIQNIETYFQEATGRAINDLDNHFKSKSGYTIYGPPLAWPKGTPEYERIMKRINEHSEDDSGRPLCECGHYVKAHFDGKGYCVVQDCSCQSVK